MKLDNDILSEILSNAVTATNDNVGDKYVSSLELLDQISSAAKQREGEYYFTQIRSLARDAEIGWKLFRVPQKPPHSLSREEQIRIITVIGTLHSFCYGVERLDEASFVTGPDSTPVRFYINSLYHFIAALFLIDKRNDPIGGMVYKTLEPMGLENLLGPIKEVLDKPMEGDISFSETIRNIRNKFLVHGTFSPTDISTIVNKTHLRNMTQQLHLTKLIWELFNQSFILKLKLIALLTASKIDPLELAKHYIEKTSS